MHNQQQVLLELDSMTCEGSAAPVQQALDKVPGVAHAEVNYSRSEAVVTIDGNSAVSPGALIQAVRDAGYDARLENWRSPHTVKEVLNGTARCHHRAARSAARAVDRL